MAEDRPVRNKIPSVGKDSLRQNQPQSVYQVQSPNRANSSSVHAHPLSSPVRAAHNSAFLPSPTGSSGFTAPTLPPILSPSVTNQNSAHSAHLQDLQHQISVKTLAYTTLQREYDSLIQKLERQRTKCLTLEKKFEVSDAEINALTDERNRLLVQIGELENQLEDLVKARDCARKEVVANGAQYMRIVQMAGKLQAQSALEKKKWDKEKKELEARIRQLEGRDWVEPETAVSASEAGSVASTSDELAENINSLKRRHSEALHRCSEACRSMLQVSAGSPHPEGSNIETTVPPLTSPMSKHTERTCPLMEPPDHGDSSPCPFGLKRQYDDTGSNVALNPVKLEIARLRDQNRDLQARLQKVLDESKHIKAVASSLAESGDRMFFIGNVADCWVNERPAPATTEELVSAKSNKGRDENDCVPMEVDKISSAVAD